MLESSIMNYILNIPGRETCSIDIEVDTLSFCNPSKLQKPMPEKEQLMPEKEQLMQSEGQDMHDS